MLLSDTGIAPSAFRFSALPAIPPRARDRVLFN